MTKIEKKEFLDRVKNGEKGAIYEIDADDLMDILEIIMDGEDEEEEEKEEPKEDKDALIEEYRKSAIQAKKEVAKLHGEERAQDVVDYAAMSVMLSGCLELDMPIKQEWVEEYNRLEGKLYPEISESALLPMAYMLLEKMKEDGVKSLE